MCAGEARRSCAVRCGACSGSHGAAAPLSCEEGKPRPIPNPTGDNYIGVSHHKWVANPSFALGLNARDGG